MEIVKAILEYTLTTDNPKEKLKYEARMWHERSKKDMFKLAEKCATNKFIEMFKKTPTNIKMKPILMQTRHTYFRAG